MNYNSDRILNLLFFPFLSLLFVSFANRNGICILIYTRNKSNERRDFLSPSDDIIYIYIYSLPPSLHPVFLSTTRGWNGTNQPDFFRCLENSLFYSVCDIFVAYFHGILSSCAILMSERTTFVGQTLQRRERTSRQSSKHRSDKRTSLNRKIEDIDYRRARGRIHTKLRTLFLRYSLHWTYYRVGYRIKAAYIRTGR